MKTLFTFLLASVLVLGAYGQVEQLSKKELKRLQKEQKKAQQEAEREQNALIIEQMILGQKFVLEADYLSDKTGTRVPVQSMINFVMVDSVKSTVQFGSAYGLGYNGVGGATVEGRTQNYKYQRTGRNKTSFTVNITFSSPLGMYDITLFVNPDGNTDATIRGNWGGNLNYHGRLVPLSQSRVYKGHSF
jgi:hypothetical protein